jgi:putative colanic acid biosynthesis acetyltransferase WcaF
MSILQNRTQLSQPSFSLKNRIQRVIWWLVYYLLFRFTPNPFHAWRAFILRLCGAKIGKQCHIYPRVLIWAPWNLEIHDQACLGNDVRCYSQARIIVGKQAIISQGTHLCTGTHNYNHRQFQLIALPIKIDSFAWIGAEAFIGPGVHIAEGTVIGARAVIFKNTQAWKVYIGNPAICIKDRIQPDLLDE